MWCVEPIIKNLWQSSGQEELDIELDHLWEDKMDLRVNRKKLLVETMGIRYSIFKMTYL